MTDRDSRACKDRETAHFFGVNLYKIFYIHISTPVSISLASNIPERKQEQYLEFSVEDLELFLSSPTGLRGPSASRYSVLRRRSPGRVRCRVGTSRRG